MISGYATSTYFAGRPSQCASRLADLWAFHYDVPVVIASLKNGTYAVRRWFARALEVGELAGMDLPSIDFTRIARGYGVPATSGILSRIHPGVQGGQCQRKSASIAVDTRIDYDRLALVRRWPVVPKYLSIRDSCSA